jgi:hypothetical protein
MTKRTIFISVVLGVVLLSSGLLLANQVSVADTSAASALVDQDIMNRDNRVADNQAVGVSHSGDVVETSSYCIAETQCIYNDGRWISCSSNNGNCQVQPHDAVICDGNITFCGPDLPDE